MGVLLSPFFLDFWFKGHLVFTCRPNSILFIHLAVDLDIVNGMNEALCRIPKVMDLRLSRTVLNVTVQGRGFCCLDEMTGSARLTCSASSFIVG